MIARSRFILERLNDDYLVKLVDVTELRLDSYFQKELKLTYEFASTFDAVQFKSVA